MNTTAGVDAILLRDQEGLIHRARTLAEIERNGHLQGAVEVLRDAPDEVDESAFCRTCFPDPERMA